MLAGARRSRADYVLHVASPFPAASPKDDNELIVPAREGALRGLRAARDAGVKRVVLTSSFAAIGYGKPEQARPFDERDWTDPAGSDVTAYIKSKTLAERAAWDFMTREGGSLELAVINPTGIVGPVLSRDYATSVGLVKRLLDGDVPGCPRLYYGLVDVRDVADLHLRAMTTPAAGGERFLAVDGDFMSILQTAQALRRRLGAAAKRVPRMELPNWLVRLAAMRDTEIRSLVPELGKRKNATSAKAIDLLGWKPRPAEEALVDTARSLARFGLLKEPAADFQPPGRGR
jgi:dihydroflavonol-4-reductase